MSIDGSISDKNTLNENYPFPQPSIIPPIIGNDKLLQVFLTDYVFNTFSYSLFSIGKLSSLRINPQSDKFDFNVIAFSLFWPNLLDKYKWDQHIEFECGCLSFPTVFLNQENIQINGDIGCSLLVKMNNGEYETPFKVDLKISIGSLMIVEKGLIKIQIKNSTINEFTTIFSEIGELNLQKLQDALNFALHVAGPIANNYLNDKGIAIPTMFDIDFGDAVVIIKDNFVELDMTPIFHTSLLLKSILKKDKFDSIMKNTLKLLLTKKNTGISK